MPERITLRQASEEYPYSLSSLRRYVKVGFLKAYRRGIATVVVDRADVEALERPID